MMTNTATEARDRQVAEQCAATADMDEGIRIIQDYLGVTDGDFAGIWWMPGWTHRDAEKCFAYLIDEREHRGLAAAL